MYRGVCIIPKHPFLRNNNFALAGKFTGTIEVTIHDINDKGELHPISGRLLNFTIQVAIVAPGPQWEPFDFADKHSSFGHDIEILV